MQRRRARPEAQLRGDLLRSMGKRGIIGGGILGGGQQQGHTVGLGVGCGGHAQQIVLRRPGKGGQPGRQGAGGDGGFDPGTDLPFIVAVEPAGVA